VIVAVEPSVMAVSDTALIVGVFVFVSGVMVNGVLLVDKVMVGEVVLSVDVESEREIVILVGRVMVSGLLSLDDVESENEIVSKVGVSAIVVVVSSGVKVGVPAIVVVLSGVGVPAIVVVVLSGVICSPTLDTSGSSINIPDRPGVFGIRAESAYT
jgi:hypothetical protein